MIAFTRRQWNWLFASVLILGGMFILATRVQPPQTTAAPAAASDGVMAPAPLVDHSAPDFTLSTLDGTKVALSDLKGQVLLINVWATWCPPCRVEMPTIQAAYEQYHDQGFTVVAVNLQEDSSAVATFMREHQLTFPALLDEDGQVSRSYQAVSLPSSFFVDRRGVIRAVYHGPMPRSIIAGTVEQLLQEGKQPMYPLIQIGPLRLSSGGLLLLLAIMLGGWLIARVARARGGAQLARQADSCFYPVLIGALIGARLWYGLFNLDLYGRTPGLFLTLRVSDVAWPGALLGGMLAGYAWCRRNGFEPLTLADSAALTLPVVQAIASVGLLLSGEAFGAPTSLPWGVPLFGAVRHPTQLYFALAALGSLLIVWRLSQQPLPVGALWLAYLGLQGLSSLLIEALRADSLALPGGIRAAQVFGLALLLYALSWMQRHSGPAQPVRAETSEPALQEQS